MAALTWRNVDAPNIDLRGFGQASAGITSAFDRMATMLHEREANLRTKATNDAIAQGLATQDPEAVRQMLEQGTGSLGRRVDALSWMKALGEHRSSLINTGARNEEYQNMLAKAEAGDEAAAAALAAFEGNTAGRDEALAQIRDNPLGRRYLEAATAGALDQSQRYTGNKLNADQFEETKAENLRSDADRDASRQIAAGHLALARANAARERDAKVDTGTMGVTLARKYAQSSDDDFKTLMLRDPLVTGIKDARIQAAVMDAAAASRPGWTTMTSQERNGAPGSLSGENLNALTGMVSPVVAQLEGLQAAEDAKYRQLHPGLDVLSRSAKLGDVTRADVSKNFDENTNTWFPGANVSKLLRNNSPAEVQAAIDNAGGAGFFDFAGKYNLPGVSAVLDKAGLTANGRIARALEAANEARGNGGAVAAEAEISMATSGLRNMVRSLQGQLKAIETAGVGTGTVNLQKKEDLEQRLERAREMLRTHGMPQTGSSGGR